MDPTKQKSQIVADDLLRVRTPIADVDAKQEHHVAIGPDYPRRVNPRAGSSSLQLTATKGAPTFMWITTLGVSAYFTMGLACGALGYWYFLEKRARNVEGCGGCLPLGLSLSDRFGISFEVIDASGFRRTTTVREKLLELGAYSQDGVIFDRHGKKVIFYRVWEPAMRPGEMGERLMDNQRKELDKLDAECTVVRMYATKSPCAITQLLRLQQLARLGDCVCVSNCELHALASSWLHNNGCALHSHANPARHAQWHYGPDSTVARSVGGFVSQNSSTPRR
jgi:hypothetical protein